MKLTIIAMGVVSLSACATSNVSGTGPVQLVSGENGDLRAFLSDACPGAKRLEEQWSAYIETTERLAGREIGAKSVDAGSLGGVAAELLSGIGGLMFRSFGEFLRDAGAERATRSSAMTGGYFFARAGHDGALGIAPHMRCIYLVRNGFSLKQARFAPAAPEDLRRTWADLGLNRTPDLFAVLHLETTADAELSNLLPAWLEAVKSGDGEARVRPPALSLSPPAPYFRAKLDSLYIHEFQYAQGAPDYRDLAIVLNYASPGHAGRGPQERGSPGGSGAIAEQQGDVFAAGGVSLFGAQKGDYRDNVLSGLMTGWMSMPPGADQGRGDPRGTVNMSAHIVESAPGNPLLHAIGSYLAGEQVTRTVSGALRADSGN